MVTFAILLFVRSGNFDVVVIQDQSQRPSFGIYYVSMLLPCQCCPHPHLLWSQVNAMILPDVAAISRAIQETNPCTQPVFFLTWGKRDGDSQNCHIHESFCSFEGIQAGIYCIRLS